MMFRVLLVTLFVASLSLFAMLSLVVFAMGSFKLATITGLGTLALILMSGFIIEAHYSPMDEHYGDI